MSTPISASATITLTFGKQKVELTQAEAKKLLAELQNLVGEKPPIFVPTPPVFIERYIDHVSPLYHPQPPLHQPWEITCRAGGFGQQNCMSLQ